MFSERGTAMPSDDSPNVDMPANDKSYRIFRIKKRSGGWRQIEAPPEALKVYQRRVLMLLDVFRPSPFSYGVHRGGRVCAEAHAQATYFARMDIENFFSRVTIKLLRHESLWHRIANAIELSDLGTSAMLLLKDGKTQRLPQGAPTSPMLADLVMKPFDFWVARMLLLVAKRQQFDIRKLAFTRYVDDIFNFYVGDPQFGENEDSRRSDRGCRR